MTEHKKPPVLYVNMPDEIRRRVYNHEVLLSFGRDDDAVMFIYWWNQRGKRLFDEWRECNFEEF